MATVGVKGLKCAVTQEDAVILAKLKSKNRLWADTREQRHELLRNIMCTNIYRVVYEI